jgi:hypothetical protein
MFKGRVLSVLEQKEGSEEIDRQAQERPAVARARERYLSIHSRNRSRGPSTRSTRSSTRPPPSTRCSSASLRAASPPRSWDHPLHIRIGNPARRSGPRLSEQSLDPSLDESITPFAHRLRRPPPRSSHGLILDALGTTQIFTRDWALVCRHTQPSSCRRSGGEITTAIFGRPRAMRILPAYSKTPKSEYVIAFSTQDN